MSLNVSIYLKSTKNTEFKSFLFKSIQHFYNKGLISKIIIRMTDDRMTQRLAPKDQTLQEAYDVPANFLEIDVCNPETHGIANKRYTDYEVRLKVSWT